MADRKQDATDATKTTKANPSPRARALLAHPSPTPHPSHGMARALAGARGAAATTRRTRLFRKGGRK